LARSTNIGPSSHYTSTLPIAKLITSASVILSQQSSQEI
jgi:hypothetical protein